MADENGELEQGQAGAQGGDGGSQNDENDNGDGAQGGDSGEQPGVAAVSSLECHSHSCRHQVQQPERVHPGQDVRAPHHTDQCSRLCSSCSSSHAQGHAPSAERATMTVTVMPEGPDRFGDRGMAGEPDGT